MANRWAVANGNWSNTATWNGGTLPTSADDVFSNNFTVTIDGTFTVLSISNLAATGINAGGSFTFANGGDLTCTAGDGVKPGASTVLTFTLGSGNSGTIRGNAIRSASAGISTITCTGAGTFNIVGNLTLSSGAPSNTRILNISASLTINHIGDIINNAATSDCVIFGGSFTATYNHTGNIQGGNANSSTNGTGIQNSVGVSVLNYNGTGNQISGTSPSIYTINANITIVGNVTGTSDRMAINNITNPATINVNGIITAGANQPAIVGIITTFVQVQGTIINQGTYNAIYAGRITLEGNVAYWQYRNALNNTSRNLYTVGALNYPVTTNVRNGVVYGSSSEFTGTLAVPSPSNVLSGVPTDNTIGTYTTTPDLIATEIFTKLLTDSDFNTNGSFGKLVKDNLDAKSSDIKTKTDLIPNNPTSNESVGAIVASYNA